MKIQKSLKNNERGFSNTKLTLITGAALSITLLGGGAFANFSNPAKTQNVDPFVGIGYCVKAEFESNPEINAQRGNCSTENEIPDPGQEEEPPLTDTMTQLIYKCDEDTTGPLTFAEVTDDSTITIKNRLSTQTLTKDFSTTEITFTKNEEYKVTLDGKFNKFGSSSLKKCARAITAIGEKSGVTTLSDLGINLVKVPESIPSTVTSLFRAFYESSKINDTNISKWNTTKVKNVGSAFFKAETFNQSLNDWNTINFTNTSNLFRHAAAFNQPLDNWKTLNVTNMSSMFANAKKFDQPINHFNTGKVKTMNNMFWDATEFDQPLNKWNTSIVTDMSNMFYDAHAFDQDLSGWDVRNVTSFDEFAVYGKLSPIHFPNFINP